MYFIDAPGGTGKTYLLNNIIEKLSHCGKNVCSAASSGVAAILLKGGGTLHGKLKIPIPIEEGSSCRIKRQSKLAREIQKMDLLIWDEAPMFNKYHLECINRSLKDIRRNEDLFGGITLVLSGDWRQILPVVTSSKSLRPATVEETHKHSELWHNFEILHLTENMRVSSNDPDSLKFKKFLLDVGEGKLNKKDKYGITYQFDVPKKFLLQSNRIIDLIDTIFPDMGINMGNEEYLDWISERGIIAPTNKTVDYLNQICLKKLPGQEFIAISYDQNELYPYHKCTSVPIDNLQVCDVIGLPPHKLQLKNRDTCFTTKNYVLPKSLSYLT